MAWDREVKTKWTGTVGGELCDSTRVTRHVSMTSQPYHSRWINCFTCDYLKTVDS